MKYTKGQVLFMRVRVVDSAPFDGPKSIVVESVDRAGKATSGRWYVADEDELVTPQSIRDAIMGKDRHE